MLEQEKTIEDESADLIVSVSAISKSELACEYSDWFSQDKSGRNHVDIADVMVSVSGISELKLQTYE